MTERFFDDLDALLPPERSASGTPSTADFLQYEIPRILERLATDLDGSTVAIAGACCRFGCVRGRADRELDTGRRPRQSVRVPEPSELVGLFVVEVGERQAWPFLQFCDNAPTPSREVRLYIGTLFDVSLADPFDAEEPLHRLLALNDLTVGAVVGGPGLELAFTDGSRLRISEEPQSWTSGDLWSLSPWLT